MYGLIINIEYFLLDDGSDYLIDNAAFYDFVRFRLHRFRYSYRRSKGWRGSKPNDSADVVLVIDCPNNCAAFLWKLYEQYSVGQHNCGLSYRGGDYAYRC